MTAPSDFADAVRKQRDKTDALDVGWQKRGAASGETTAAPRSHGRWHQTVYDSGTVAGSDFEQLRQTDGVSSNQTLQ
jgi:hypothetical protein